MLDGIIEPGTLPENSKEFQEVFPAISGTSCTLKFNSKRQAEYPIDYTVMALEGLWRTESGEFSFEKVEPWHFSLLMMRPDPITETMYHEAVEQVRAKRPNPALDKLRFARLPKRTAMPTGANITKSTWVPRAGPNRKISHGATSPRQKNLMNPQKFLILGGYGSTVSLSPGYFCKNRMFTCPCRMQPRKGSKVGFSPDGRYIVTGSSDRTVRLWTWRPKDLIFKKWIFS